MARKSAQLMRAASGQTAPSSFVTAAAGLAPIADVLGGRPWRGLWATLRPTDHASGASGVHPTPEAPASRTVGSAAPVSPMCHIAPWMRLPLAPVGPPPERPALLRASSALRRALSGHLIAGLEEGEGAGVCMELEGRSFWNSEVRILPPQPKHLIEKCKLFVFVQCASVIGRLPGSTASPSIGRLRTTFLINASKL